MNGSIVATSPCSVTVTRSAAPWLRSSSSTSAASGAKWAGMYIRHSFPRQRNGPEAVNVPHLDGGRGLTHSEIVGNTAVTCWNRGGKAALYPGGRGGHFRGLPARRGRGGYVRGPGQAAGGL